jgi:hypothetical protein
MRNPGVKPGFLLRKCGNYDMVKEKEVQCMKGKYLKYLYGFILIILIIAVALALDSEKFDTLIGLKDEGAYLIHEEALIPREDVSILFTADGKIFLYYKNSALLNIYSVDGDFLHGIQFPNYQNGVAKLHYEDGLLYADIPISGTYVFKGAELLRFEGGTEFYLEIRDIFTEKYPNTDGEYTYVYVAENNRILKNGNGEQEVLLQFPQKSPHLNALLGLLAFWIVGGCEYWGKLRKTNRQ